MKIITKTILIVSLCAGLTACASLNSNNKVLKAPCGPTAGMTDPCGNRTPINTKIANAESVVFLKVKI